MVLALVVFLDFARLPISAPDGNSNSGNRLRARLIRICRMETAVKSWTLYLASGIEAASAVVIGLAALEAILRSYALFFQRGLQLAPDKKEEIRLRLGRWLAVALEFEVAADILRTAIAPSVDRDWQVGCDRRASHRFELLPAARNRSGSEG